MANWYYYNESGDKIEVTGGQLKGLAKAGTITPDTIVETEDGKKARAGKVKGLTFAGSESEESPIADIPEAEETVIAPPPQVVTPPTANVYCTYCGQPVQPTAAACTACGADPRVHRKFCYACGTPVNEVQVICTKCHTPIAGAGSVPIGQTPGQAAPMQSVTQPQSGAIAQLVIDLSSKFNTYVMAAPSYDVLINGQIKGAITTDRMGNITSEKNIEISVPTGWFKLEVLASTGGRLITPVAMDIAAGQNKKVFLRPIKYHELRGMFFLALGFILSVVAMIFFLNVFGDSIVVFVIGLFMSLMIFVITPIFMFARFVPSCVIETEVPTVATP